MKAYELLKNKEWLQFRLVKSRYSETPTYPEPKHIGFCIGGAILACYGGNQWRKMVERLGFETWTDMVDWNNHPRRTKKQVLARLRKCDV